MHRRYGWLVLLSVVVVAASVYAGWMFFQPAPQLPFTVHWVDANHARIEPIPGLTPPTLHAGDRLELAAQPRATRIALVTSEWTNLPSSASYPLVIERGAAQVNVSVHAVDGNSGALANWAAWIGLYTVILFAGIALLALWRGHDRAAAGMALWALAAIPLTLASAGIFAPGGNRLALLGLMGYFGFALLARIGFYVMAESIAGSALSPRRRALWRGLFALVLGAAAITLLGGRIAVVTAGWAGLMQPWLGLLMLAAYLVPIALLIVSYRHADARGRQRLRWLLWGSVVFVAGLAFVDLPLPLSVVARTMLNGGLNTLGAAAMLYAVLRHRVVDVTVVLNRALVYAATTSLVLGLFALLESLIEHTALGHGASLLLELAVPLALGAGLSTVHRRIEAMVERFIFRHQYRMEAALRRFAEDCAFITQPQKLFELGVEQIARHTGAPLVALYERGAEGYVCMRQRGERVLPETVVADDLAFVALRARNAALDLHDSQSALGASGHAFPLMLRGNLLGALVVGERPGERYAADERALLFHVAHEMGMALFALRAQESEARAEESAAQAQECKTQAHSAEARARASEALARATENQLQDARTRESALLNALSAVGSGVGR
ncbi:MAG: hypothetical protein ACYCOY_07195 [Metallibacterium sp.]